MAFGRVFDEVAVVQGADPEILEPLSAVHIDGIVELACMGLDELQYALIHHTDVVAGADRLRKGVNAQPLNFLVDECGQQPCGELGICGLVGHER